MRTLITGAGGFIARSLIPLLLADGHEIMALVRDRPRTRAAFGALEGRLHYDTVDLRDRVAVDRLLRQSKPEVIYHLAAAGVRQPFLPVSEALSNNLMGTVNLLQAAFTGPQQGVVKKLITSRTPGERTAMNHYAASKAAAWQFCRMYARTQQWPIVGAMIFQAYGPHQDQDSLVPAAVKAALKGRDFPMTAGTQERDWIYVHDVARGLMATAVLDLEPGSTIELGTGCTSSVAAVVSLVYDLTRSKGKPLVGALPSRPGEEASQAANVQRADHQGVWQAVTTLRDGLNKTIAWYDSVYV